MRLLVLVLAGLAGLKVWTHDHIYRSATEEAIVNAYRDRAIEACAKDRRKDAKGAAAALAPSVSLVIGRSDVDVAIWDVDNPLWAVRFKYPQLVVTQRDVGGSAPGGVCTYDITLDKASTAR